MNDPSAKPPQTIYFDEAGYTGSALLDRDQPHFVFASVAIDERDARQTVLDVTDKFRLQGNELKGSRLTKHDRGHAAIDEVLSRHLGAAQVNVYDKEYALACKFFEYTFEPVLASCSSLFYGVGFHRYIANLLYLELRAKEQAVEDTFVQFERIMRTGDCTGLRNLLDPSGRGDTLLPPTTSALLFTAIHEDTIRREVEAASKHPDGKSWALDLSMGAVFNMLQHWGRTYDSLKVVCDRSKPLKAHAEIFDAMIGRADKAYLNLGGNDWPLTFNLSEPIALVDSHDTPGVQIADVIASATAHALRAPTEPSSRRWLSLLEPHMGPGSVTTDLREFQPDNLKGFVGTMILNELVDRAAKQESVCAGMAEFIHASVKMHRVFLAEHDGD